MFDKYKKCSECNEKTKTPCGFWDGRDANGRPTSGIIFSCENTECPIKQEEIRLEQEAEEKLKKVKEENLKNNIDIKKLKDLRNMARATIKDSSEFIGVTPSLYCDYEYERKPMPVEKYNYLVKYFGWLGGLHEKL